MRISKANFFNENSSFWGPLQETINDILISSTVLSINLTKTACIEISINRPLTYFVEYILEKDVSI